MPGRIYKAIPEAPITVEATQPCQICKKEITKKAVTESEKSQLYALLKLPWVCPECNPPFYDMCND